MMRMDEVIKSLSRRSQGVAASFSDMASISEGNVIVISSGLMSSISRTPDSKVKATVLLSIQLCSPIVPFDCINKRRHFLDLGPQSNPFNSVLEKTCIVSIGHIDAQKFSSLTENEDILRQSEDHRQKLSTCLESTQNALVWQHPILMIHQMKVAILTERQSIDPARVLHNLCLESKKFHDDHISHRSNTSQVLLVVFGTKLNDRSVNSAFEIIDIHKAPSQLLLGTNSIVCECGLHPLDFSIETICCTYCFNRRLCRFLQNKRINCT